MVVPNSCARDLGLSLDKSPPGQSKHFIPLRMCYVYIGNLPHSIPICNAFINIAKSIGLIKNDFLNIFFSKWKMENFFWKWIRPRSGLLNRCSLSWAKSDYPKWGWAAIIAQSEPILCERQINGHLAMRQWWLNSCVRTISCTLWFNLSCTLPREVRMT